MSDAKLREFLKFDESDLLANRNGKLSENQKKMLTERRKSEVMRWIIVLVVYLASLAGILFLVSKTTPLLADLSFATIFKTLPGPAIVVLILLIFLLYKIFRGYDDTLKSMQGEVEFVRVERQEKDYARSDSAHDVYKTVQAYEMHVGDITYGDVNEKFVSLIKQGNIYKFHYTKDGGILSGEMMKKEK